MKTIHVLVPFISLLLLSSGTASSQAPEITTSGKYMYIDSQPFFPIGLYHLPDNRSDDAIWKEIADAGFNFILSDEPGRYGIYVSRAIPWDKSTGGNYNLMETYRHSSYPDKLKQFISENEDDSTMICWHAPDEPTYFGPSAQVLRPGYDLIKANSKKPVWLNIGPSQMVHRFYGQPQEYTRVLDVFSQDIYPIPDGKRKIGQAYNLIAHQVGINTATLLDLVSIGGVQEKPVWMVLQGFGWGEFDVFDNPKTFVAPTMHELRFMYYDAIVNGATGILSYGPFSTKSDTNTQFWKDLKDMVGELQNNYDFLTCPWELLPHHLSFTSGGDTLTSIQSLIKLMDGKVVILAVNSSDEVYEDVQMHLEGWKGFVSKIKVLEENRRIETRDNLSWKDDFEGYGVHLYETDLYFPNLKRYYKGPPAE